MENIKAIWLGLYGITEKSFCKLVNRFIYFQISVFGISDLIRIYNTI